MPKVKICGNTNYKDARLAVDLGADFLGFIFTESKRQVDSATVKSIMSEIRDFQNFVGVFANQPKEEVEKIIRTCDLKIIQFHGDETALYCEHFMSQGFQVIKTFHIRDRMSLKRLDQYNVTAYMFDTYSTSQKGGTGVPFDWNLIEDKPFIHEKLFLAGGLNTENLREAVERVRPFAVDVASGVESEPGIKDPALLEEFIRIAKRDEQKNAEEGTFCP